MEQATTTQTFPVFVHCDDRGSIHQAVGAPSSFVLFSKTVVADWGTDLRIGRNTLTLDTCGVALPFIEDAVPVIDIVVDDRPNLRKQWHRIPQAYTLSELGLWTLPLSYRLTTT